MAFLHTGHIYRQQNNVTQIALANTPFYFAVLVSIPKPDSEISKSYIFSPMYFLAVFTLKGGGVEDCIPKLNVSCVNTRMCKI